MKKLQRRAMDVIAVLHAMVRQGVFDPDSARAIERGIRDLLRAVRTSDLKGLRAALDRIARAVLRGREPDDQSR